MKKKCTKKLISELMTLDHEKQLQDQKNQMEKEMESIVREHEEVMEQMLTEFSEAKEYMEQEIKAREQETKEWETKYLNRSSRMEDLEKIKMQTNENKRLENQLIRCRNELGVMKRELLNKEKSLNQVFGSKPKVGVLNPRPTSSKK